MVCSSLLGYQLEDMWEGENEPTVVPEDAHGIVQGCGGQGSRVKLFSRWKGRARHV